MEPRIDITITDHYGDYAELECNFRPYEVFVNDERVCTSEKVERLKAENAKLRELVRIMHSELVSCENNGYVCGGHKFDNRVRELGIEVD